MIISLVLEEKTKNSKQFLNERKAVTFVFH